MASPNPRNYIIAFIWLGVLTLLGVGLAQFPIPRIYAVIGIIALAIAKIALVGLVFMHIRYETVHLRNSIIIPFLIPVLFAIALICESANNGAI